MVCDLRQSGGPADTGPRAFPVVAPSAAASRPDQVSGGERSSCHARGWSVDSDMEQASGSNRRPSAMFQAASAGVPSFAAVGASLGQPQGVAAAMSGTPWCTAPGSAAAAPWPSAGTLSTGNDNLDLPRAAQDLVASLASAPPSFSSPALSRHSRVSEKLKSQISPQSYSVSIQPSEVSETPMFSVSCP